MLRLLAILGVGLYVVMLIGGQDRGQLRFGLMQTGAEKTAQGAAAQLASGKSGPNASQPQKPQAQEPQVVATSFAPEKPLMTASQPAADPVSDSFAQQVSSDLPGGRLRYIAAENTNVREGPGKDHAVLERLPKGEAVLVLTQVNSPDGWSLIRIEGDGVEGYVASRLLTD